MLSEERPGDDPDPNRAWYIAVPPSGEHVPYPLIYSPPMASRIRQVLAADGPAAFAYAWGEIQRKLGSCASNATSCGREFEKAFVRLNRVNQE